MTSHHRPANYKFGLGYYNNNSNKSRKKLKPNKGKLPSISFVKVTSTDTQASHDADELVAKKELKYVEPTDKSRWLSPGRRKGKQVKFLEDSKRYLDSECSMHMNGNRKLLTNIVNESGFRITFGDNSKDYACCKVDRKSTIRTCQFLGDRLISWYSKKQTSIATSTVDAKYLATRSCCAKLLWIQQKLKGFGIQVEESPIFCDNTNAIAITYNPVLHSMTNRSCTISSEIMWCK
ncbi:uncharacterized protein LOC124924613 [Impatiens glandulifera]|uniref:uncharacterized protein LOC124924613 n=1 Tax=Impatiens glandulifera TaxID=253017 RepID=UPI001FB08EED|nr:uncharacterized protein LOC124924613 [Impatiens glandulifera]